MFPASPIDRAGGVMFSGCLSVCACGSLLWTACVVMMSAVGGALNDTAIRPSVHLSVPALGAQVP